MGKKGKKKSQQQRFDTILKNDAHSQLRWSKKSSKKKKNVLQAAKFNPFDVDMDGSETISRPGPKGNVPNNVWHKIVLHNAAKFPKEAVLQPIVTSLATKSFPLEPICFQVQGQHYSFYIESPAVASELKKINKQIQLSPSSDFTLIIKVSVSPSPPMKLDLATLELIKSVMSQRFIQETSHLNLNSFHSDNAFLEHSGYIPLARAMVMSNVISIINTHVPHVASIDFSNNKLPTLDFFSTLETPQLKFLSFDDNRLDLRQLEKLKPLKLHSLNIKNNRSIRCCDIDEQVKKKTIEKIMDILPTLKVLNGEALPKNITFDEAGENGFPLIPPSLQNLLTNDMEVNSLVQKFIQTYFSIYDSDNKELLLRAYDDNALFSLCSVYPPDTSASIAGKLQEYMPDSRNLKLVTKKDKRDRLLKQGRISIVAMLSNLPRTTHILKSFSLDIVPISQTLFFVTVAGFFYEAANDASGSKLFRHFNRTFLLVRTGSAFTVINDILYITLPTKDQQRSYELLLQPEIASEAFLVQKLSQESGMNSEWSKKCLDESGWDYSRAIAAFREALQQSLVPAEAFSS